MVGLYKQHDLDRQRKSPQWAQLASEHEGAIVITYLCSLIGAGAVRFLVLDLEFLRTNLSVGVPQTFHLADL
jgi:hypothetical protein